MHRESEKANRKHEEIEGFSLCLCISNTHSGQGAFLTPHHALGTQHKVSVMEGANAL